MEENEQAKEKKEYATPQVTDFGSIEDITQAGGPTPAEALAGTMT